MAPTPPKVGASPAAVTSSGTASSPDLAPAIKDIPTRDAALKKLKPLSLTRANDSADVFKVQDLLKAKGYPVPRTGVMDAATVAAVKKFQTAANIPGSGGPHVKEDGIVGQQTYALLMGTPKELLPPPGVNLLDCSTWQANETFEARAPNFSSLQGGTGSNEQLRQYALQLIPQLGLHISSTTGGEHATNSRHYLGEAIDVGGPPDKLDEFYRSMQAKEQELGVNAHELIYSPEGFQKEGQMVSLTGSLREEHFNHVHYSWNV